MRRWGIWAIAGLVSGLTTGRFFSSHEEILESPATSNVPATPSISLEKEALLAEVELATPEEFGPLYEQLTSVREPGIERALAQRELILRWIREDPEKLIQSLEERLDSSWILILWAEEEGAEMMEMLRGRMTPNIHHYALTALTTIDPAAAALEFRSLMDDPVSNQFALNSFEPIVASLARKDPAAALALAEEFADETSLRPGSLARLIAEGDPQLAVEWAGNLENSDERHKSLGAAFAAWVKQDPDTASARFSEMSGEVGGLCRAIVGSLARTDPGAAVLWADKHGSPGERAGLITGIATGLRDPAEIVEVYSKMENERAREKFAGILLLNWQDRDIEAGFDWVNQISTPETSERWLRELAGGVGSTRFDEAMRISGKIENEDQREAFRHELIVDLAGSFPEKAMDLAEKSGNKDLYFDTLDRAIRWNSNSSYWSNEKIAGMFDQFPEDRWSSGVYEFGKRWFQEDRESAVKWMDEMEHPKHRREAIQSVLGQMTIADPESAKSRAALFTEPADRNEAYSVLAKTRRDSDPAEAFALANKISYRKRRNPILTDIVRTWAMRDPAAARSMVESAPNLSPRERQRLLARIYQ